MAAAILLIVDSLSFLKRMDRQADIDMANQKATTDYDLEALKQTQTSWRDEYLTVLLSLPVIGSFFPVVQDSVVRGWEYLGKAPMWFQVSWIGVIAATFGLRWLYTRKSE
ncbi:MAG: hypothetical protein HGA79_01135 [Anaerolineales bacterium]|nr:hypothetical protein [Anaerolineales bacterium]